MRHLAQARNPYSRSWLWIPGSRQVARPGMTVSLNHRGCLKIESRTCTGGGAPPVPFSQSKDIPMMPALDCRLGLGVENVKPGRTHGNAQLVAHFHPRG